MTEVHDWRWPAEWEPQDGVLLAWPHEGTDWAPILHAVESSYAALVSAIAARETAIVCVASDELAARARRRIAAAGGDLDRVRFVAADYDDTWLRDSGPVVLTAGDAVQLLDFRFTGWGGKFGAERDDRLVEQLEALGLFRGPRRRVDWALEGGGIEGDGAGTVLSTYRCLHQRHPHISRGELIETLSRFLGASRVHLLEYGYLEGDDTDAHIDTLARFASASCIVYQGCDDPADLHHRELAAMAAELAALRRPDGGRYRLVALPWAGAVCADDGRRLAASYANFLIVDGAVLMPAYDVPTDAAAREALAEAFPDRVIVPVPCRALIEQNGSLHCVTMQLPRGTLAQ